MTYTFENMKVITWGSSIFNFNFCPKTTHETFELNLHLFYFIHSRIGWKQFGESFPPRNRSYHSGKGFFRQLPAVEVCKELL